MIVFFYLSIYQLVIFFYKIAERRIAHDVIISLFEPPNRIAHLTMFGNLQTKRTQTALPIGIQTLKKCV